MRGKEQNYTMLDNLKRITPAYAGKRAIASFQRQPGQDHPRICGEKQLKNLAVLIVRGSPPHMRGKGSLKIYGQTSQRITPAYAGKRGFDCTCARAKRDHPRICGEKLPSMLHSCRPEGSPPHMRGKENQPPGVFATTGITPAYAGKRHCKGAWCERGWDHPRICGEKPFKRFLNFRLGGSPPHMRGKVSRQQRAGAGARITPAYAGKSGAS